MKEMVKDLLGIIRRIINFLFPFFASTDLRKNCIIPPKHIMEITKTKDIVLKFLA